MKLKLLLLAAVLSLNLVAFQEGAGESCDNYHATPEDHKCSCARATMCPMPGMPINPDTGAIKCKMSCKPAHCKCLGPCTSRH